MNVIEFFPEAYMSTLYKSVAGLIIIIILVNIFPSGIAHAHGVIYDTVLLGNNKIRITLKSLLRILKKHI